MNIFEDSNLDVKGYISKDIILEHVSEEKIFSLVFGFEPKEYDYVTSPFRPDKTAGCWFFYSLSGKLKFTDFGSQIIINGVKMINIDCFDAVQQYYKLPNLYNTLLFISDKLLNNSKIENLTAKNTERKIKEKVRKEFLFEPRMFNDKDKRFWYKYGITKDQLIRDKVFPVRKFKITDAQNNTSSFSIKDPGYMFTDFNGRRMKLYRPYIDGFGKFLTNCTPNDIGCINSLPLTGNQLVITKSYKDCRVLKNLGLNSVYFQNEGMFPSLELLLPLCRRFNRIYIIFDNDKTGIEQGQKLYSYLNTYLPGKISNVVIPQIAKVTDTSDFYVSQGEDKLLTFLKEKIR